jgi:hypothetical protein
MIRPSARQSGIYGLKAGLFLLVFAAACYYFIQELIEGFGSLSKLDLSIKLPHLSLALTVGITSYLPDILIWKSVVSIQNSGDEIGLRELSAVLYASLVLKYLPGWVWPHAAHLTWMQKRNITKYSFLYIHFIGISFSGIAALYSWAAYLFFYPGLAGSYFSAASVLILAASANFVLVNNSSVVCRSLATVLHKRGGADIPPVVALRRSRLLAIQLAVTCGWILPGVALYLLAKGVGLPVDIHNLFPIMVSVVTSWVIGYLVLFCPGGVGVREATMLALLKPALAVEAALILPLLSRVLFTIAEAAIGGTALWYGVRHRALPNLLKG